MKKKSGIKRLKDLREACNLTQAQLAKMMKTTQRAVAGWETGKAEPGMAQLRDLAMIFSTSVDDLLGVNPFSDKIATNWMWSMQGKEKDLTDGFWGHLGLLLPGQDKTAWFPITLHVAEQISSFLSGVDSTELWTFATTLNNRIVAFNPAKLRRIWLLDDACDGPGEDWTPGDFPENYVGYPLEFYRGLDAWASGELSKDNASATFRTLIKE